MSFETAVIKSLSEQADEHAALKMRAYMKNKFEFFGVPSPARNVICQEAYTEYAVPDNAINSAKQLF
jgi:3-methyladenine DNA glycosylase AlkD